MWLQTEITTGGIVIERASSRRSRAVAERPAGPMPAWNNHVPMRGAAPIDVAQLMTHLDEKAVGHLDEYFNSGNYTGGQFERFAGGGDRSEAAERFTSEDIVAVSLLGVRIPGRPALIILDLQAREFNALVGGIPQRVDLWETDEESVGPNSAAARLWRQLVDLPGVNWVTAGKLIARKRPRLIPVYDRVVKSALGRKDDEEWWRPLRTVLREHPEVIVRLDELREGTGLGQAVSLRRILDVCIWMGVDGEPEHAPDADA